MTGFVDGRGGQRPQPALADVFGIEVTDVLAYEARKPQNYDALLSLPDVETENLFHYGSAQPAHALSDGIRFCLLPS